MPDLGLVALSFLVVAVGFHVLINRDIKRDRAVVKASKEKRHGCGRD